jgi:hypothetical protein
MDPSIPSFKPGDIVIIEDIHQRDAHFNHKHLFVDEICVHAESGIYASSEEPLSGYVCAYLSPLFSENNIGYLFFIAVKIRHLST